MLWKMQGDLVLVDLGNKFFSLNSLTSFTESCLLWRRVFISVSLFNVFSHILTKIISNLASVSIEEIRKSLI